MELLINNVVIDTNKLLNRLLYVEDYLKSHNIIGRYHKISLFDEGLIKKWRVRYRDVISNLKAIGVINQTTSPQTGKLLTKYHFDKSLYLITILTCIGISALDSHNIKKAKKEGIDFLSIVNSVDNQLKQIGSELYKSNKKYEQMIIDFVYKTLDVLIPTKSIQLINHYDKQKVSLVLFYENNQENIPLPSNDDELRLELRKILFGTFNKRSQKDISSSIQNVLSLSNLSSISSSSSISSTPLLPLSSSHSYLYNSCRYIDLFIENYCISLLSQKGKALLKKNEYTYEIEECLKEIKGFGITLFSVNTKTFDALKDYWNDENTFERTVRQGILKYLNNNSPLFKTLNELIGDINKQNPLFQYTFKPKVVIEPSLNGKSFYYKVTGRQYNPLCDVKAHNKIDEIGEAKRNTLLKQLGYDSEGYDISSTIWTITKALTNGEAQINFDLKQELVNDKYFDINGKWIGV